MSTPDTMDTIDEAEQAWREYKNNSSLLSLEFFLVALSLSFIFSLFLFFFRYQFFESQKIMRIFRQRILCREMPSIRLTNINIINYI